MRSFWVWIAHQISFGWSNQGGWDKEICATYEGGKKTITVWQVNLKGKNLFWSSRNRWEDNIKWILNKLDSWKWTWCIWFKTLTSKRLRTAFLWVIMQRVVVISYRRFGTIYRVPSSRYKDGADRSRNVGKGLTLLGVWLSRRAQFSGTLRR